MGKHRLRSLTILLALAVAAVAARPATAAERPLSLQQAIERAVAGNADLQRERITIEVSNAQIYVAAGAFDFRLTSDLIFSRQTTPSLGAEDLQGGFNNELVLDLGLARQLESGGLVSVGMSTSWSNTNARIRGCSSGGQQGDCTSYSSDVGLSFSHPLLRGFGSDVVQANLRKARVQQDQALLNRQMRASNIVRDVINTYWGLSFATQDLAIQRSAVQLAQEQLRVTKAQIDVGRLAPVDSAAVERAIGERQQAVLLSEQEVLFQSLALRRLFGLPPDPQAPVYMATDLPEVNAGDVDVGAETARALQNNPQLKTLALGMKLSEIDIQTARSTLRPQLDFVGRIGATGRRLELADAVAQALGFDDMTWSAGLQFEVPLENRTAEGQMRIARASSLRTRLDAGDYEVELRHQVMRLASQIRTARKRVDVAKATVGFATQDMEAEKARFSVGRSTNNDVLLRQQELKNQEIQVVRATVDLLIAETTLSALTSEILERYRIVLKGQ